jgi:hypothetical protein
MHDVTAADRRRAACGVSAGFVIVFGTLGLVVESGDRTQAPMAGEQSARGRPGARGRNQAALSMFSGCALAWSGVRWTFQRMSSRWISAAAARCKPTPTSTRTA